MRDESSPFAAERYSPYGVLFHLCQDDLLVKVADNADTGCYRETR